MTNSEEIFLSISYNDIDNIVLATGLFSVVIFICYYATHKIRPSIRDTLMNKHVLVTGGSCGIGRSIALLAASNGANVTILARDKSRLASVKQEMISACNQQNNGEQILQDISLDVTGPYEAVEKAIRSAEEKAGPVHMLVTCAGTSICSRFEDTPMEQFERMVKLNLLGSVGPAKAVTRGMKARGDGYIVFTASLAAMFGIYGYSAYSASKFAIRGVAEALHMEVKPYGVGVTVALPPDTDTPGFAEEEKGKLEETRLISQAGGLVSPDVVAEQILTDAIIGKFFSTVSFESLVVATSCVGMSPSYSSFELAWQLILMGPLRVVSACLLFYFNYLVETCMKKRDKRKRSE